MQNARLAPKKSMSKPHDRTFAELYCEQHALSPEQFQPTVLNATLYPHAKLVAPLFRLLMPRFFSADLEFVQGVGQLKRFREYFIEAEEFAHHPLNRGFWRVTLNIRVSSRRLRRLVRQTLHGVAAGRDDAAAESNVPFGGVEKGTESSVTDLARKRRMTE